MNRLINLLIIIVLSSAIFIARSEDKTIPLTHEKQVAPDREKAPARNEITLWYNSESGILEYESYSSDIMFITIKIIGESDYFYNTIPIESPQWHISLSEGTYQIICSTSSNNLLYGKLVI